jgi:hypothetical protein
VPESKNLNAPLSLNHTVEDAVLSAEDLSRLAGSISFVDWSDQGQAGQYFY